MLRTDPQMSRRVAKFPNKRIYVTATPDDIFTSNEPVVHQFITGIADR